METFDAIVIGAGPGGYVAAIRAAQAGLKVAICERDARLGGTCLLRGCIPTKSLLHAADLWTSLQGAKDYGIHVDGSRLDFGGVQAARDKVVGQSARGVEFLMKKNKITWVPGHARLDTKGQVVVSGGGGSRTLSAGGVIIASGSVPRHIRGVEVDGRRVVTSDELLEVKAPPKSLTVLGGGAVGVEFASIFARFGTQVTLVEMQPTVLPIEDSEVGAEMQKLLAKRGIEVMPGTRLERLEAGDAAVTAHLAPAAGAPKGARPRSHRSDMLLCAIGRAPVTAELGLEEAGIVVDDGGYIQVDPLMQTTRQGVFAIGDVVRTPWLAHVASAEGILAADQIAGRPVRPIDYLQTPSCTYSDPEVASVGLTERAARERGLEVKVGKFPFSAIAKARIAGHTEGFVKWVAHGRYNEIVGLHIIGEHATELIASGGVALRGELCIDDIAHTIYAHPTVSESILEAAHAAMGHALHI